MSLSVSENVQLVFEYFNQLELEMKNYMNIRYPEEVRRIPEHYDLNERIEDTYFPSLKTLIPYADSTFGNVFYFKKKSIFSNKIIALKILIKATIQQYGFEIGIKDQTFTVQKGTCNLDMINSISVYLIELELKMASLESSQQEENLIR